MLKLRERLRSENQFEVKGWGLRGENHVEVLGRG